MAYGQRTHDGPGGWRARYRRPDGSLGSESGFSSETAAENWGLEQEALIRRNLWIDPADARTTLTMFSAEWLDAIGQRLSPGTLAKYETHLRVHLVPQWGEWPMIAIFNSYLEIEKWVTQLHEDGYADNTVASIFATFSTLMNAAVRARIIPASPCTGIRVTSGAYEAERLVASPVQGLRAAMRLHEAGLGLGGFVLCLANLYSGARWGELVGQQRHEYDHYVQGLTIKAPLKEVNGAVTKSGMPTGSPDGEPVPAEAMPRRRRPKTARAGRTKTPAGTRTVRLPPGIATLYEMLMASHDHPFVFTSPLGQPLRRANFRQRFWRPAWDGIPGDGKETRYPPILPWFTFHEGRHTHSTWMIEDGVPEVARRARLGQKMKGIARTYDHVTEPMQKQILDGLEARWRQSINALRPQERVTLLTWLPHLEEVLERPAERLTVGRFAIISPFDLEQTPTACP
ncbi:tyrosine-type recombinase/integrase [Labedaea rhizosphaerae]|uniref:Phage integrase family protein n=1 Tax=Labedaea rhizosphaerae TaxID=598644 RepID=A0A4R6SGL6_LABRH|nr:site-specific integrase [Labedaea rhizosphaerae]TDQ00697.1 phage integrase family protein [Labedaea rhizosphaerae]